MTNPFAGETFLQVALPDFQSESRTVAILLIGNAFFWIILLPALAMMSVHSDDDKEPDVDKDAASKSPKGKSSKTKPKEAPSNSSRRSARNKGKTNTKNDGNNATNKTIKNDSSNKKDKERQDSPVISATHSVMGLLIGTCAIFFLKSPYNYYTPRRVFMAPLLTQTECQHVIQMAERAAAKNFQQSVSQNEKMELELAADGAAEDEDLTERYRKNQILQLEPIGWQKIRHASYPTTDLNLVTDPFTPEDRLWLSERFHARLAPLLSRVFGIPQRSIRSNDMFVVRYDAPPPQGNDDEDDNAVHRTFLANHTDDSDISFNILLNENFEGGGTRFWDRLSQLPFAHVQPTTPGTVLTHSALINHEGATVTRGTRMILVGFLSVDRVDPFVPDSSTGLSFWASWGCGSWLTTKFKQAYMVQKRSAPSTENQQPTSSSSWTNNIYFRGLILNLAGFFLKAGDVFGTHAVEQLVPINATEPYLKALDEAAEKAQQSQNTQAVWWHGQGLQIGVDGSIAFEWRGRQENKQAFEEL